MLMRSWTQAKAGDGCVVLISGEPGIGKSRIAEAMQERLGADPHIRLRFFCSPYHQDSALYPAIAQLERAVGFRREDTPEQRLAKLEAVLVRATNDISEVAPLIADLLSIPTGERYPALSLTPQKAKEEDAPGTRSSGRGFGRATACPNDLRGRTLERSEYARIARPAHRARSDRAAPGDHHFPARVLPALGWASPSDAFDPQSPAAPAATG
jgi:AAA ATPase domain